MLRLVIFDFDGVIADTERAHYQSFAQVLRSRGIQLSWQEYLAKYLGYEDYECLSHILEDLDQELTTPPQVDELVEQKVREFAQLLQKDCGLLPGVRELITDLQTHDILCSVCSGALRSEIEFTLQQVNCRHFFHHIVSAEDVRRSKPDPEGFRLSLARANNQYSSCEAIQTDQCLVIEDSAWGIQAAKAADMFCLAVATSYSPEQLAPYADTVIKDLTCLDAQRLTQLLP